MAIKYKTEAVLRSKEFAHLQKDFLKALLPKEEYTMAEAKKIVKAFFEKKGE